MSTTTTIPELTVRPVLIVLLHTAENGYQCSDPTCPCQEVAAPVVDSYLVKEPSWLRELYRPISSGSYYEPDEAAPIWQLTEEEEEIEDLIEDDDYPSKEQIDAMFSDYSGWQSDYL
jgi:hypothetical protein